MTEFKKDIIKKLEEKNLSESTIKMYIRNLELLNHKKPLTNLNFLKHQKEILEDLDKKSQNTKRNYLISIVSVLKQEPKMKKLYSQYYDKMMNINKELKIIESSGVKTEKQAKNWVEWDTIKEKLDDLKNQVSKFGKNLNENQYNILLKYVVLSLYVYLPPRRNKDYQKCMIIQNRDVPESGNICDMTNKKFYFRDYKTAKTEGHREIDINNELYEVLEKYMKYRTHKKKYTMPLLTDYEGNELKNINSITLILNNIFGLKIGSSMLRHIYLSKYRDVKKEMEKDAKDMSHSNSMQTDYIKK